MDDTMRMAKASPIMVDPVLCASMFASQPRPSSVDFVMADDVSDPPVFGSWRSGVPVV